MSSVPADVVDVVVVGARPAGAATALLLARAGLRVVAFDRAAPGADTTSTHALMRGGVLQLTRWGLLDAVVAAGTPAVRSTVYTYGGARRTIAIKPAHGVDALYAPRRTLLDPVLADAARAAGAEVVHRTRVTAPMWERGRVVGVHTTGPRGPRDVRARLVVGADGVGSLVARRVGAAVTHRARWHSAVTYGYWSDLPTEGYEWAFAHDACAGAIPTGDGLVCVFAAASPARIGTGGVGAIRAVLGDADPELAARLDRARAPGATRTWRGTPGFLRAAHGPGWALVGDAGAFRDPIVAHGLTDALRDAELLARAVAAGLDHRGALAEALTDFEATRDRLALPVIQTADRLASQLWDDPELDDLVRRISSATAAEVDLLADLDRTPLEVPR